MPEVGVIIAAGGRGRRMGGRRPKQFLRVGSEVILEKTVAAFQRHSLVRRIVVVVPGRFVRSTRLALSKRRFGKVCGVVAGGRTRQESVRLGLDTFVPAPDIVLVHDAVRPLIDRATITGVIRAANRYGAAVAATPVTDTIKLEGRRKFAAETLPRHRLWAVQTPQGFRYSLLRLAHRKAKKAGFLGTDEAALVERLGKPVRLVESSGRNMKITTPGDLLLARFLAFHRR